MRGIYEYFNDMFQRCNCPDIVWDYECVVYNLSWDQFEEWAKDHSVDITSKKGRASMDRWQQTHELIMESEPHMAE